VIRWQETEFDNWIFHPEYILAIVLCLAKSLLLILVKENMFQKGMAMAYRFRINAFTSEVQGEVSKKSN